MYELRIKFTEKPERDPILSLKADGFDVIDTNQKDEFETLAVKTYIKEGTCAMTTTMIHEKLEKITGKSLSISLVGSALASSGIIRKSARIAGNPVKCYCVEINDMRMINFLKAQEKCQVVYGVKTTDYTNPDDFNEAVAKAKNEKKKPKSEI